MKDYKPSPWVKGEEDPWERFFTRVAEVLFAIGIPIAIIGFIMWAIGIFSIPLPIH